MPSGKDGKGKGFARTSGRVFAHEEQWAGFVGGTSLSKAVVTLDVEQVEEASKTPRNTLHNPGKACEHAKN